MNIKKYNLEVSGFSIEITRKEIRNLHIGVYPPNGRVRVSAPLHLSDEAIRLAIITRLDWIRRKQKGFLNQIRESKREMVSGESHYFNGRRYILDVRVEQNRRRPAVREKNRQILQMLLPPDTGRDARERILEKWFRRRLRETLPGLVKKWETRIGVRVNEIKIRKMKTRWGSCNIEARRIWLNLELAKKSPACLEYIFVHEMVHFLERRHSSRFVELMDSYLPNWRILRDELNAAPLSYAQWKY